MTSAVADEILFSGYYIFTVGTSPYCAATCNFSVAPFVQCGVYQRQSHVVMNELCPHGTWHSVIYFGSLLVTPVKGFL